MESNMEEQNVQTNNIPPKIKNPYSNKSVKRGGRFLLLLILLLVIGTIGYGEGWFKKEKNYFQYVTDYVIPDGTIQIENDAFRGNRDLKIIIIPNSVKSIGEGAFANCCWLESVIFEDGSKLWR